ncbi:unnamed protein product, partial [marine sediment metagenome]
MRRRMRWRWLPPARDSGQAMPRFIVATALAALGLVMLATAVSVYAIWTNSFDNTANDFASDTLEPPTGLGATGGASVDLNWTATADTYASGHRVLRGTDSGGPYSQIAEVTPRTTTTYPDSPADGTYYYVARAFYQNWESVNGNEASATVGDVALDVEKGSFTRQAGLGNQTVTLTDSTLTPKVILFWGTNKTSEGVTANQTNFYGFMVNATEQRAYGSALDDQQRDIDIRGDAKAIVIMNDGSISGDADFVSFTAGSFTIDWTTNDDTPNIIHYTAIGGAALASVKVGDFSMPTDPFVGEFAEDGVGFQPDIVLFLGDRLGEGDYPLTTTKSGLAFGAAVSSDKQWAISMAGKGDKAGSGQNTSQVIQFQTNETTISAQADFVAMEADGFRINVTNPPAKATKIAYLAMAGTDLNVDVGSFDQPTSTGIQEITTGVNTEYAHLMSFNKVA